MSEVFAPVTSFFAGLAPSVLASGGCAVLLTAFGFARTKDAVIAVVVSVYIGALFTALFPYYEFLTERAGVPPTGVGRLIVFSTCTVLAYVAFRRYVASIFQHQSLWRTVEVVTLAVTTSGLLFTVLHHVVGIGGFISWWPAPDVLFSSAHALGFWLAAPIVALLVFVRP
jgi:hypothetical protein